MGMVIFVSRKTGQELQADFPLHPSLVSATKPDGSTLQLFRPDWDVEYSQQLPKLPDVDVKALGSQAPPPYEGPALIRRQELDKVPAPFAAWFELMHDQLTAVDAKIAKILAIVEADAADDVDDQDDDTQPR